MRKRNKRGRIPQGVGHAGDARRMIAGAANGPHDGERHEGKPGQRKQGSRHEDDWVAGPGAMAASCKGTPRAERQSGECLRKLRTPTSF